MYHTVQYKFCRKKIFGETVHTKNWQIIFWQIPKIAKMPEIIIIHLRLPVKINGITEYSCMLHMVKLKRFNVHK